MVQCGAVCCSANRQPLKKSTLITHIAPLAVLDSQNCDALWHSASCCNTLQLRTTKTATHGDALQHTAPHCNTLRHTATHCNTLQHAASHCSLGLKKLRVKPEIRLSRHDWEVCCSVSQCVAVCCSVLQCVAACCSVLQLLQCGAVCVAVCVAV